MAIYSTKARGIWVEGNDAISATELAKYDFLIAKVGDKFHTNVQTAYDCGKPLIMWYAFRPGIWSGTSLAPDKWPADQNVCLNEVRSWIMSGSSKRAIHGIIVDCSEPMPDNKTDVFWLTMTSKKFIDDLWAEFKIPNYLYMNRNPLGYFNTQTGKDALFGFVASQDGMSTITLVNTDADGVPLDGTKPLMDYNNTHVWFWLYKVVGTRILCNYFYGNKAQLYSDLNYIPNVVVTPPTDPIITPPTGGSTVVPPVVVTGSVDLTALVAQVAVTNSLLGQILAVLNKIFK